MDHPSPTSGAGSGWLHALRCILGTRADRRNQILVAAGIILWAFSYVLTNEMIAGGRSVWLIAIPAVLALLVTLTYARFLRQTDEYVRLMQLQALALGFALAVMAVATFEAMHKAGVLIKFGSEPASVVLVSWAVAQFVVAWHHR